MLNGYGIPKRKVWFSCGSTSCTCLAQCTTSPLRGSILQPIPKASHAVTSMPCKGLQEDFYKTSRAFLFLLKQCICHPLNINCRFNAGVNIPGTTNSSKIQYLSIKKFITPFSIYVVDKKCTMVKNSLLYINYMGPSLVQSLEGTFRRVE